MESVTTATPAAKTDRPAAKATGTSTSPLFTLTIFMSAALVFLVEPMVGKLLLPLLGGAPAVWNTSLAFFQVTLLLGYAYAHLLQRLPSLRFQVILHACVLGLAALSLPLHITSALGDPDPTHPVLWMLGALTLSIGGPFAALSATAPLVQAWFTLSSPADPITGKVKEPYALYAASNIGSLLALVAYPLVVEPLSHLSTQRLCWSIGFVGFGVLILSLGLTRQAVPHAAKSSLPKIAAPTAGQMLIWVLLAAAPSSLMMGVTTYITTDIASAPFLWVVPLALYLITFILAFADKPFVTPKLLYLGQALALCVCIFMLPFAGGSILTKLIVHLFCFFLTGLICHVALAERRPDPRHLTLYYLCMSLGGVVGGSFNAFVAPVIFQTVIEYPLILVLATLARPWNMSKASWKSAFGLQKKQAYLLALGSLSAVCVILLANLAGGQFLGKLHLLVVGLMILQVAAVFLLRDRAPFMTALLTLVVVSGLSVGANGQTLVTERSFFGVSRVAVTTDPRLGLLHLMYHGTTIHGAQALNPTLACTPMTYYAPQTGIGQTVTRLQAHSTSLNIAAIGLGAGIFSSYARATDHLTFYEIDPLVLKLATDPQDFTYTSHCAKSPVSFVLGDARLTLAHSSAGKLDMLLVDAFSSDAVPAHLLTREAMQMYLSKLRPDGVMVFNLTNRHLELRDPVIAAIQAAGGVALEQTYDNKDRNDLRSAHTVTVLAARSTAAIAAFHADPRWKTRDPGRTPAWTDDYTNLIGAFLAHKG